MTAALANRVLGTVLSIVAVALAAGCGPDSVEPGEPPAWAMGVFHLPPVEVGGDYSIDKIEVRPDGSTTQTSLSCGIEDSVSTGSWRHDGDIVVVEPEGDNELSFARNLYARLELREAESCDEIFLEGFRPTGPSLGADSLQRGDRCLQCSNVGEAQLQWCTGAPPEPCDE